MWIGADYETDTVIQESLRTELDKDVTVITVAHRLQTIMDSDKVVRRIVPPPPPLSLLRNNTEKQITITHLFFFTLSPHFFR